MNPLVVEVWSDVACPWCYIGKRRWEAALAGGEASGAITTIWRSFQLDPAHPKGVRRPHDQVLMEKYRVSAEQVRAMDARVVALAAAEGLEYHFDRYVAVNTFDAHRLAHLARAHDLGPEMHERLFRGQFVEGAILDDADTLVRLGTEVGVPADEVERMLESGAYADDVTGEIRLGRSLGVTGVPFFVFDRRFAVSGAQPTELFTEAIRRTQEASLEASAAPDPA